MMRLRRVLPAFLVMILALLATIIAAVMVHRDVSRAEQRQFLMEAKAVQQAIAGSMRSYELALSAGAALFQSVGDVSDSQWRAFVSAMRLTNAYPGYQGLGFAQVVHRDDVMRIEKERQAAGDALFKIRPNDGREILIPIVMLEPRDWRNERAMGFDMFSEAVRRQAMERARDTGYASLTGKVVLVQETGSDVQAGTLMYLPVYAGGVAPSAVEERRQRLRGFTYMAMRMDDLIRAVLQRHMPAALQSFGIALYDGTVADESAQLFQSAPVLPSGKSRELRYVSPLEVAGRIWTVSIEAAEPLAASSGTSRPWIVLGSGLIISTLIGAIAAFQAVARANLADSSDALAAEIRERKKAQEAVEMANGELIHRVKNTLAVVSAIASQTSRTSTNMQEFNSAFRERLAALGRVQDLLRPGAAAEPELLALIEQLLQPYVENAAHRLKISGPPVTIATNDVVLFSLAFNELATNAIKYGAWAAPEGKVALTWKISKNGDGEDIVMMWLEQGSPVRAVHPKEGFGTAVLRFAIERAMNGKITIEHGDGGICYVILIPNKRPELQRSEVTFAGRDA